MDAVLVEVWMSSAALKRLRQGTVWVRGVSLHDEGDGTFSLALVASVAEARLIDWPVHGPDAEYFVRG